MAKKKTKTKNPSSFKLRKISLTLSSQQKLVLGSFLLIMGILLCIAFLSFLFTWQEDQSTLSQMGSRDVEAKNWLNKFGAWVSDLFIHKGFGVSSFVFSGLIFLSGIYVLLDMSKAKLRKHWFWGILVIIWLSVFFGFFAQEYDVLGGTIGFEINSFLQDYLGKIGTSLLLLFGLITYLATRFRVTVQSFKSLFKKLKKEVTEEISEFNETETSSVVDNNLTAEAEEIKTVFNLEEEETTEDLEPQIVKPTVTAPEVDKPDYSDIAIEVEESKEEEVTDTNQLSKKLVEDFGEFDPTLELGKYQFPPLDLLKKYDSEGITINQEELEENKNRIVDTLNNYKIGIASIKATIGPTVTLYEIVPEAGIRISKIKNLEDDIALSLSALGIRIIAPIPGKGTIGIEVPNKNATVVSMRSVIAAQKFQKAEMQLPIALGKTISNETFVVDLAKMPHLLMAGATGQGKSVGLNAVLTSLLYKKHPAEVKFVLVDPKKVELTLFNKIERHYLAKL
ncbi:MAG: DNA translocase FtsK, partial [Mangrovimonas sp.]|nr:DNA translocase FtsK [Mangrovimonas sp.]